ncbi:hypothetical protein Trydic_g15676 [Trypoxylus dichotomus]
METIEENHNNNGDFGKKDVSKAEIVQIENYNQKYSKVDVKDIKDADLQYSDPLEGGDESIAIENAEEPIDLTSSQTKIKSEFENGYSIERKPLPNEQLVDGIPSNACLKVAKCVQPNQLPPANPAKKRGRKKKDTTIGTNSTSPYESPEFMQIDSRQGEVLMAAKSLFSKRTRTLYHWMYPNAPKAQLKSAVSMSWETLGVQEKEFYISQVLGRFGFPQSSLMINPQLGGLRGVSIQPPLDLSAPAHINLETHTAVSTIVDDRDRSNEAGVAWSQYGFNLKKNHKRRGRIGRPPGTKNQKLKENVKPIAVEPIHDDFPDDPELRKEFEQFKWTLHLTDK